MSKLHSPKPPTASPGAASDGIEQSDLEIVDAGRRLSALGVFGLIVLDRNLIVTGTVGRLIDFIKVGKPLVSSLSPVLGLEDEILKLRNQPNHALELPAVAIASDMDAAGKLNFTFFWSTTRDGPTALVHQSQSQAGIENELSRQIRARLMAEAEVTQKSKELARANADLESFAAIISHDLKAPLRHMRQLIEKAYVETDTASAAASRQTLERIEKQAQRMSGMLTALLDYSTFGRKYEAVEIVDTRALAEEIRNSLPRCGRTISITGDWPRIATLRAPLDLVIRNLVSNALKHHDRADGNIVVSCEDQGPALAITVSDDGPGIDPRHHQAIFLPFRTLETEASETATGMGLAAVKKAVLGVEGTISVHSDPASARGTRFRVTWPKLIPG